MTTWEKWISIEYVSPCLHMEMMDSGSWSRSKGLAIFFSSSAGSPSTREISRPQGKTAHGEPSRCSVQACITGLSSTTFLMAASSLSGSVHSGWVYLIEMQAPNSPMPFRKYMFIMESVSGNPLS